jgi:integrase
MRATTSSAAFLGPNPASEVARRKVVKRLPDFLHAEEVPRVLNALSDRWRPLFATAIFIGMRRGELPGLRKSDVDLSAGLINIARSHAHGTTKGKRAEAIPIARELVPYLQQALKRSPCELVFPNQQGGMMRPDVALEGVLRRALGRAGIVQGYTHVCRKKGCGYSQRAGDAVQRRCPEHDHLLWPKAVVRPLRFHDLRHTTASLLMMAGANPAAVQRILRHRDPRITMQVYGHLTPGYLQAEVDRLQFGLPIPEAVAADEVAEQRLAANAKTDPFAAPVLQSTEDRPSRYSVEPADLNQFRRYLCTPRRIRTYDLRLRRPTLYPAELVARGGPSLAHQRRMGKRARGSADFGEVRAEERLELGLCGGRERSDGCGGGEC